MVPCTTCDRKIIFGGYKTEDGTYCSLECHATNDLQQFCNECLMSTTDESPGNTTTCNGIGTTFLGLKERCKECHSVVRRKAFCFLYIPIIPLSKYRIIYCQGDTYIGRKLK